VRTDLLKLRSNPGFGGKSLTVDGIMRAAWPSIAVVPFRNLSRDPDNEYFSDGLTEELINLLSKVAGSKVDPEASRSASCDSKMPRLNRM
jgi:TolB-like protein